MNTAYIVAGYRSPVGKSGKGVFKYTRPDYLAAEVIKYLVASVPKLEQDKIAYKRAMINNFKKAVL